LPLPPRPRDTAGVTQVHPRRVRQPAAAGDPARGRDLSDRAKTEAIRALGADLRIGGERYADALAAAQAQAAESGALPVHAFDQRETILGQGSVGLELSEQVSGLDTVLVPVGGGGLIAGAAAYFAGRARGRRAQRANTDPSNLNPSSERAGMIPSERADDERR
jgi:threonine dehydratase